MIDRPFAVPKNRKVSEIIPDRSAEKAAKLKKYLAKVATSDEEKAFLKKINGSEPESEAAELSGSDGSKGGNGSD